MHIPDLVAKQAKAILALLVILATYVSLNPPEVANVVWWSGLVIFVGGGYGVVYLAPNRAVAVAPKE
jgi:hypothetical protein